MLAGLDSTTLIVHPLFAEGQIGWLACTRALVRGKEVAVAYDSSGSRYGFVGLAVWVGGSLVAHSSELRRLVVPDVLLPPWWLSPSEGR